MARHVLVVGGSTEVREALCLLLEAWGHLVTVADDGDYAVELARAGNPEVVLVDLKLEDAAGCELVRRFRSDKPDVPPLIVAYSADPRMGPAAREAGCDVFIVKPDLVQLERLFAPSAQPAPLAPDLARPTRRRGNGEG